MTGAEALQLRRALGLSTRQLARWLGLSSNGRRDVRRWEADEKVVPELTAQKLRAWVTQKLGDISTGEEYDDTVPGA